MRLANAEVEALFALARGAIQAHLEQRPPPELPTGPGLEEPCGAFVTLRTKGELRGCIGFIQTERPLAESVRTLAVRSAFGDRRFEPLRADEYPELELEISVLSPPQPVPAERLPDAVVVGRHGLIVRRGPSSGLLLPQVASERGWDARTFLQHTSAKAGLPPEAWEAPDAQVEAFECEIYEESP